MASPPTPIIFTIARMNPPHPGHMFLISELLADALATNATTIYILLSSRQDGVDNPLDCDSRDPDIIDKKRLVDEMVNSVKRQMATANPEVRDNLQLIEVVIICIVGNTFSPLSSIMSGKQNIDLRMIVGIDRSEFYDSLCSMYLFNDTPVNQVSVKLLTRTEDDEGGVESMSATKIRDLMRGYVSKENKADVDAQMNKVYEGYVIPENIVRLVDALSKNLVEVKKDDQEKESKPKKSKPAPRVESFLTETRHSDDWNVKMQKKIAINEAKVAKKSDDKIEIWFDWAESIGFNIPSRAEVGAKVGDKAEVGGKLKKTKQKRRKTMKRRTMRRIRRKTKTSRNYYKK